MGADHTPGGHEPEDVDPQSIDWESIPLDDPRWDLIDDIDIDDDEPMGTPPDPSQRSWRHPAEVAAANAHMGRFLADDARSMHPSSQHSAVAVSGTNRALMAVAAGAMLIVGAAVWTANRETVITETAALTVADPAVEAVAVAPTTTAPATAAPTTTAAPADTSSTAFFAVVKEAVEAPPAWAYEVLLGEDDLTSPTLATAVRLDGLDPQFLVTSATAIGNRTTVTLANHHYLQSPNDRPELVTATLVGADPDTDIAVLQVDLNEPNPPAASIGSQARYELGSAIRIFPGIPVTSHSGTILSITDRAIDTSAPAPNGHLGAAVVNVNGAVVGLVVHGSSMLASALPADEARRIAYNIAEYGYANPNWLGVTISATEGIIEVVDVVAESPSDLAGLEVGDRLLGAGGSLIVVPEQLIEIVAELAPGSDLDVVVQRDDEIRNFPVTVGQRPKSETVNSWVDT